MDRHAFSREQARHDYLQAIRFVTFDRLLRCQVKPFAALLFLMLAFCDRSVFAEIIWEKEMEEITAFPWQDEIECRFDFVIARNSVVINQYETSDSRTKIRSSGNGFGVGDRGFVSLLIDLDSIQTESKMQVFVHTDCCNNKMYRLDVGVSVRRYIIFQDDSIVLEDKFLQNTSVPFEVVGDPDLIIHSVSTDIDRLDASVQKDQYSQFSVVLHPQANLDLTELGSGIGLVFECESDGHRFQQRVDLRCIVIDSTK